MKGLEQWLKAPIKSGDTFYIKEQEYLALGSRGAKMICSTPEKKHEDRIYVPITHPDIVKKDVDFKGPNPFDDKTISFRNFGIESILSYVGIGRKDDGMLFWNWNPYFIINGEKVHYQRGYVWSLEQKQALISSIYRNLEIGRIIVHFHSYEKVEKMNKAGFTDFAPRDIVDGKQRISTIIEFYEDKFCDENGYFYSDLSNKAKHQFGNYSGLLYGEMDEYCSPEQICDAFLNNAVAGTPISKEHIEFMIKTKNELLK